MNKKYITHNYSDEEIIEKLTQLQTDQNYENKQVQITISGCNASNYQLGSENPNVKLAYLYDTFQYILPVQQRSNGNDTLNITRTENGTFITVTLNGNSNTMSTAKIISNIQEKFPAAVASSDIEKSLGHEISKFYDSREKALLKLEELSQKIIKDNEEFRNKIEMDYQIKKSNDQKEKEEYFNNLDQKYVSKEEAFTQRIKEFEIEKKDFDDKSNTHARRELQKNLKKEIQERNNEFKLTDSTINKRKPIHILFLTLIISLGILLYITFNDETRTIYYYIKLGLSTLGFSSMILYYINWNNSWFKRHADEEFRLKKFSLDLDRASWIAEMYMEWQNTTKEQIPDQLVNKFSHNLFEENNQSNNDNILSKILASSTEIDLNVPNIANVKYNSKGTNKLSKIIEKENK